MGALLAVALVAYAVVDEKAIDDVIYIAVLGCASVLAWVGVVRSAPGRRLFGALVAAGITLTGLGDLTWELLARYGYDNDVSVADPLWFASYAALCAALGVLLRRTDPGSRARFPVLDALTVAVVSALVFWDLSIHDIVDDGSVDPMVRAVEASYPVADATLLALVVTTLASRGARAQIGLWFAGGVLLWLAADIAYLGSLEGGAETLMDMGWMVAPFLLVRSAWPGTSTRPVRATTRSSTAVVQVGLAIVPLLVPPVLMLLTDARDDTDHVVVMVAGATVLTLLALVRTARLVRSEEQAQRELELARDAALAASQAKSMFLATMSHEIRTPLTKVLGALEILEDGHLDEQQRRLVHGVRHSGDELTGLVRDILDYSRMESGAVELVPSQVALRPLVDELVERYAPRARAGGIGLEHRMQTGAPETVLTDRDRVLQVVGNLLDNALKFTPHGHVALEVRPVPRSRGAWASVEIAVTDTGIGIDGDDLPTVFDAFRQVDGSSTRRYGGTGLGLAICRHLVDSLGGELTVTSEPGAGSAFVVRLPLTPQWAAGVQLAPAGRDRAAAELAR